MDVSNVTPKDIIFLIPKMDNSDLELFHAVAHANHKATTGGLQIEYCNLHYHLAKEMVNRGLTHIGNEPCDKVFENRIRNK